MRAFAGIIGVTILTFGLVVTACTQGSGQGSSVVPTVAGAAATATAERTPPVTPRSTVTPQGTQAPDSGQMR